MRIATLALLLVWLACAAHAQDIPWSAERALIWTDFQGKKRPHRKRFDATTYSRIHYELYYHTTDSVRITVTALFDPQRSWKKSKRLKPYLLKHEQGHFDIAELYARKLRYTFAQYQLSGGPQHHRDGWLQARYTSCVKKMRHCQRKYDRQTNHSRRKLQQQEWNIKLANQLDELKEYGL